MKNTQNPFDGLFSKYEQTVFPEINRALFSAGAQNRNTSQPAPVQKNPPQHALTGIIPQENIQAAESRIAWAKAEEEVRNHSREIAKKAPLTIEEKIFTKKLLEQMTPR